ncbi:hypothetical protein FQN57_002379 [Myotisia sp. PD_48]|nr:hypothetical protein FQN57_002379 [Myotisia sp. PD_48]
MGPDAEFNNLERRELITKILRCIPEDGSQMPPIFWSALWNSDLDMLRGVEARFEKDSFESGVLYRQLFIDTNLADIWTDPNIRSSHTNAAATGSGSPSPSTRPSKRRNLDAPQSSKEAAENVGLPWRGPENLIALAPHVHVYWDRQLFAIEPLELAADKKSLTVRFCWLRPGNMTAMTVPDSEDHLVEPPTMPAGIAYGGRQATYSEPNIRLYNCETDARIVSGDVITLTTDDPITHPLPDIELLRLQWRLHRVLALAGAATGYHENEPEDSEDSDDDFITELQESLGNIQENPVRKYSADYYTVTEFAY